MNYTLTVFGRTYEVDPNAGSILLICFLVILAGLAYSVIHTFGVWISFMLFILLVEVKINGTEYSIIHNERVRLWSSRIVLMTSVVCYFSGIQLQF